MSKKTKAILALLLIVALIAGGIVLIVLIKNSRENGNTTGNSTTNTTVVANGNTAGNNTVEPSVSTKTTDLNVVPTMDDKLSDNSAWCATFQLIWNDLKNEIVKQDIKMNPQPEMVTNLNKEDFKTSMISDEYYYKKWGEKSPELKEEMENGIKEKFNKTSSLLDSIDWTKPASSDVKSYVLYTMLYRRFEFLNEFNDLGTGKFGNSNQEVKYFGYDSKKDKAADEQIKVLYYKSKDDFAVSLKTKNDDEVIYCKNPEGKTFNEIYENMTKKAKRYYTSFDIEYDRFKAPELSFNVLKEYEEVEDNIFFAADGDECKIIKALQTIQFSIDKKGGEILSEAVIDSDKVSSAQGESQRENRYFYVDDTFAIFLKEKGKDKPYFAAKIDDASKFQK